jgi:hypothetical protein
MMFRLADWLSLGGNLPTATVVSPPIRATVVAMAVAATIVAMAIGATVVAAAITAIAPVGGDGVAVRRDCGPCMGAAAADPPFNAKEPIPISTRRNVRIVVLLYREIVLNLYRPASRTPGGDPWNAPDRVNNAGLKDEVSAIRVCLYKPTGQSQTKFRVCCRVIARGCCCVPRFALGCDLPRVNGSSMTRAHAEFFRLSPGPSMRSIRLTLLARADEAIE